MAGFTHVVASAIPISVDDAPRCRLHRYRCMRCSSSSRTATVAGPRISPAYSIASSTTSTKAIGATRSTTAARAALRIHLCLPSRPRCTPLHRRGRPSDRVDDLRPPRRSRRASRRAGCTRERTHAHRRRGAKRDLRALPLVPSGHGRMRTLFAPRCRLTKLGEGWVAEEAVSIALDAALIAADFREADPPGGAA